MYAITKTYKITNEVIYLNHSCLNTLSFGAPEMAWTTESATEAHEMLYAVIDRHSNAGNRVKYEIAIIDS